MTLMERVKQMTPDERKFAARALPNHWPEIREALVYDDDISREAAISLQRLFDGWFVEVHVDGDDVQKPYSYIDMRRPKQDGAIQMHRLHASPVVATPSPLPTVYQPKLDQKKVDRNDRRDQRPPVTDPQPQAQHDAFFRKKQLQRECYSLRLRAPDFYDPEFDKKARELIDAKRKADAKEEDFIQQRDPFGSRVVTMATAS